MYYKLLKEPITILKALREYRPYSHLSFIKIKFPSQLLNQNHFKIDNISITGFIYNLLIYKVN